MPSPLVFQGKFIEKYFTSPKFSFSSQMSDLWTSYLTPFSSAIFAQVPRMGLEHISIV